MMGMLLKLKYFKTIAVLIIIVIIIITHWLPTDVHISWACWTWDPF